MNKKLLFIASAIMMVACSNQETIDSDLQQPVQQQASNIRSYEEALQIAQSSIEIVDGQAQTRAVSPRRIALNDTKIYKLDAKTRSSSYTNDTLMYVFNFEDNQGFSVVSANRNTDPLIAVTESGYYDPDSLSEIEGFNLFMDMAKDYIRNSPMQRLDPILPDGRDSLAIEFSYVGPFVTVKWGQRRPEGEFCPNGVSGCANTAIAQVMSYYEYPASTYITYPNADSTYQTFNWTAMKAHQTKHSSSNCNNVNIHNSISRLCRQSGYISNSSYKPATDSTSASTSTSQAGMISSLQFFGYTTSTWVSYSNTINVSLSAGHPLFICGWRTDNNNNSHGHAWIIDGYQQLARYHYWLTQPNIGSGEWEATLIEVTYTYMYHYNWGWYGKNNGYFNYNVFNTDFGIYDDEFNLYNRNYNQGVEVLLAYPSIQDE